MDEQQFNENLLDEDGEISVPTGKEQKKIDKKVNSQISNQNNAQAINAALEIGSKSNAFFAAAKKANDYSGGRLANAAGKVTTVANKVVPLGKLAQDATNNGTAQRIAQAVSKKKGHNSLPNTNVKSSNAGFNESIKNSSKREAEDYASDGGGQNLKVDTKIVKWAMISVIASLPLVIFIVLFTCSAYAARVLGGLEKVDAISTLSDEEINKKIDNLVEKEVGYDYFIDSDFKKQKLEKLNTSEVALFKRKNKELTIEDLEDYYPGVKQYGEKYDRTLVYKFFLKMTNLYRYYRDNYPTLTTDNHPILDLPLLMSTLMLQSDDMNTIFESNLDESNSENYSYDYDWSNYVLSKDKSTHDMEVLAQHMVSRQQKEFCKDQNGIITNTNILKDNQIETRVLTCKDNETYYTGNIYYSFDNEKYREFLKEFIEKKYYLEGQTPSSNGGNDSTPTPGGEEIAPSSTLLYANSFRKYDLTYDQLARIASVCRHEQGNVKGAAAEASLIANRYEHSSGATKYKNKYGDNGTALYYYVRESGWWAHSQKNMDDLSASDAIIAAVKSVLVDGKRTVPGYVDEHDFIGDIISSTNNGFNIDKWDRNLYIQFNTIIKTRYGATYTFYSFPNPREDPFGYTNEKRRQIIKECYYDFDTGNPVNCGPQFVDAFITWLVGIAQDDTHGYSQAHRSSLVDFDSGSLIYYGLLNSGFNTEQIGSSPFVPNDNLRDILKSIGFEEIPFNSLSLGNSTTNLEPGDILWTLGNTEVYIGEGMNVGAHESESESITGEYGDQTGNEISVTNFWNNNWQYVYRFRG